MHIPMRFERRGEHAPGRSAEYHRGRAAWWFGIYFSEEYDASTQNDAFHEGIWHQIQALEADIVALLARPEPAP